MKLLIKLSLASIKQEEWLQCVLDGCITTMNPNTVNISLETLIDFDRDKHSFNFGRPFLRTKDYELQHYNRSFYRNPTDLHTDEHDWYTRSLESNVPRTTTDNILTLPQLYSSVDGPLTDNVPTSHVSFFRREPESFSNHRRRLRQCGDALKEANDYLNAERQRFRPAKNYHESTHYNEYSGNNDTPQYIDKLGYRITTADGEGYNSKGQQRSSSDLLVSNSPHKPHKPQHEFRHSNNQDEHDEQNKHHKPYKPQKKQPFYVDSYTQDSVDRLLQNIEALQTDPDGGAHALDSGSANDHCNSNGDDGDNYDDKGEDKEEDEAEFGEPTELTSELLMHSGQNAAATPQRVGSHHHQQKASGSPSKGYKFKALAYSPPAGSAPENVLKLSNDTSFALSADTEITLGHIDRCIYRNSRRFGTKFDAKVGRKKEVHSREKRAVRDRIAKKLGSRNNSNSRSDSKTNEDKVPVPIGDIEPSPVSETVSFVSAPTSPITPTQWNHHPLVPLHSTHTMNHASAMPVPSSKPPSLAVPLPPVRANSLYGFGDRKVGQQWFEASPVAATRDKFDFLKQQLNKIPADSVTGGDHGDDGDGIQRVTIDEMLKASAAAESQARRHVGPYALSPQRRTANNTTIPSIAFDITAKGNIADVLLRSELPAERPTSADKALVKGVRDDHRQSSQAAAKSFRSLLALRRTQTKKPSKGRARKNLLTLVYITEEVADIERRALISIFEACGGRNWVNSSNWCSDRPVRYWHGVGVTVEGYVFEIDLSANNLTGEFPDSIHLFRQLEMVVVDENSLVGSLPDYSLSKCLNLVVLSAQHNRLNGTIPFNLLTGLDRLTDVWLSHNEFSGPLQEGVGELTALVNLCLFRNRLSGPLPASLCRLGELEVLSLGNNAFSSRIPPLVSLHKLRTLSLYNNDFSGPVPEWLETIPYLEELELFGNPGLTGFVPSGVQDLTIRSAGWFEK